MLACSFESECLLSLLLPAAALSCTYVQGVWRLDAGGPKVATSEIYAEAEAEAPEEEE
jgi:hypothetical protein